MFKRALAAAVPIVLAVAASPLSIALGSAAKPDRANLYIVVGPSDDLNAVLSHAEVSEIGPYRAPFARMFQTSADFHSSLVSNGYWLFPATTLTEICGFDFAS